MALTDESNGNGFYMPVAPAYGGYGNQGGMGFGGDLGWIILLLLAFNGGWGGMGGFGGFASGLGYDFPWLLNGQNGINNNVSDGFRSAQLSDGITSIRDGISGLPTQLCGCCGAQTSRFTTQRSAKFKIDPSKERVGEIRLFLFCKSFYNFL